MPCLLLFTLTVYKWQVTAVSNAVLETEIFCHRYLNINTVTPLSNNIFSWNLVVLSQIYSKTSAHNFIKIYSDLTFLSRMSGGLLFSWTQCIYSESCGRIWIKFSWSMSPNFEYSIHGGPHRADFRLPMYIRTFIPFDL